LRRHSHLGQLIHNSSLTERTKDVGVPDVFCFCGICLGGPVFGRLRQRAGKSPDLPSPCLTLFSRALGRCQPKTNLKTTKHM
jgi:hypothetical protein